MTDHSSGETIIGETPMPERIGDWRIIRKLGAGGMGTVYLGQHGETGREAAIKVLSGSLAREPAIVERFMREIDAMKQLRGPHIVGFDDSGRDEETELLYFVMEYIEGETLADRIRREKRLPWEQAVDIALQVCTALKAAHAAGVIHRDIKPSNLLIGENGIVKLTDFGVAQVFAAQRLTVTGGVIGTAEYMSPEQAEGRRATKKSDLYSLGAVLYVMITGRPPFTGSSQLDVIRKHQTARFDRPSLYVPDTPRLLEEIVCTLLAKNPDERLPDAHITILRLREVVRRVELATQDRTSVSDSSDLLRPTATALDDFQEAATKPDIEEPPSPGTMMRDLFRAEIDRERQARSPVARAFDNTWVLVGCLVLVIAGGFWWFDGDGAGSTGSNEASTASRRDEVERLLNMARGYGRFGDYAREEQILRSLRILILSDKSRTGQIAEIDERLEGLKNLRAKQSNDYAFLKTAIEQAQDLIDSGQRDEATKMLSAFLVLYGDEIGAAELVGQARELLAKTALLDPQAVRDSAGGDE